MFSPFPNQNNAVFNSYTPLRNAIRKANLTSSLRAIHAHIQHMQFNQPLPPYIRNTPLGYPAAQNKFDFMRFHLHPWELEILAKELILHGEIYGGTKTFEEWNYLANTVNKLKGLEEDISKIYANTGNVLTEIHRIAHRQFTWQNPPGLEDVARYWKIYSDRKVNSLILTVTGLTLDEIYLLSLALTGLYLDKYALFYPPNIEVKNLDRGHLDKFLKHFSVTLVQLRDLLKAEQQMNEKYVYAFNSLKRHPLILMEYEKRDALVCPLPTLLFRRITEGLYYEICNAPGFDTAFGESFQNFIGELLRLANPKFRILPEQTYGKPEKRTTDWIAIDSETILFVECKSKRLTLDAKINLTDTTELEIQLDKMADFIVQIYKAILDYQLDKYPHLKYDQNKVVYPILVTLEDWYVFGDKLLGILNPKIEDKLIKYNIPRNIMDSNPYIVCSVEGLDYLAQIAGIHTAHEVISAKNKNADIKMWHMENFLREHYKNDILSLKTLFKDQFIKHMSV